ncbi:MAG: biotin carboxylase N-terminal domain-containing protein [Terricaulis sp.]
MTAPLHPDAEMFRPFSSVLIANRGEIAVRIMRAAKAKGLEAIAVFSDADADAPFVRAADRAVRIGPGPALASYLNLDAIIHAARSARAEAIHPGYGFLSENAEFARRVRAAGINFIGPRADTIETMGDKVVARKLALSAGLKCPPSFDETDADDKTFASAADRIGYPLMVKAVAGGGGRGIRKVGKKSELAAALAAVRAEAGAAFGNSQLALEKYIAKARHIEIQIVGDGHGGIFHVGERDCSVQRRHQKLIEETPSPAVDTALRGKMAEAAMSLARAVGYIGVGTVEFMVGADGEFYFLEVNPRLQVEHPVTELVYGVDIVGLQLDIARGRAIEKTWPDEPQGVAIEARLLAEDARRDFEPQTGEILSFSPSDAAGIRVDHALWAGAAVPVFYDSMIAKIIAHGRDREEARLRLSRALFDTKVLGVRTSAEFVREIVRSTAFASGEYSTEFLASYHAAPESTPSLRRVSICALISAAFAGASGRRNAVPSLASFLGVESRVDFVMDGAVCEARVSRAGDHFLIQWRDDRADALIVALEENSMRVRVDGVEESVNFAFDGENIYFAAESRQSVCAPFRKSSQIAVEVREHLVEENAVIRILAPMGALVSKILAAPGERVEANTCVVRVEAMKMVHDVATPRTGVVRKVLVSPGDHVSRSQAMLEIEVGETASGAASA